MRALLRVAVAGLAVSAGAALAQTAPTKADFIAVMEKQDGCLMTEDDAPKVLIPLGFTKDEVQGWVDVLVEDKLAVADEGGLTLKTEGCK